MPFAGQRILAQDFTPAQFASDGTDHLNITTTLTTGSPVVSVTFTAPTSGKVMIIVGARVRDDGNQSTPIIDWELREDDAAGAVVLSTGNEARRMEILTDNSTRTQNDTKSYIATGLTPGQVYYAQMYHAVGAGGGTTADVLFRQLAAVPLPA